MSGQHVTLRDISEQAAHLAITFTNGDTWFDLDTPQDELFSLHGTYRKTTAGIEAAYGDLMRQRENTRMIQERQQ